jgi:hypothetical protein
VCSDSDSEEDVDEAAVRQQIINQEIKSNLTTLLVDVTDSMFGRWQVWQVPGCLKAWLCQALIACCICWCC